MASGWLIGVMVELADEPVALRHFFAVGHEDRAKAEWRAVDSALLIGKVASSPVGGLEPVHAVSELSAHTVGYAPGRSSQGEVRLARLALAPPLDHARAPGAGLRRPAFGRRVVRDLVPPRTVLLLKALGCQRRREPCGRSRSLR